MIITVGNEKGGVGKSTILLNLALIRQSEGKRVVVIDADPQGSLESFAGLRSGVGLETLDVFKVHGKAVIGEIRRLYSKYDDVFIDTRGTDSPELRASLVLADRLIIPSRPSQFDLFTLENMAKIVNDAQKINPNLKASVLLSMCPTNTRIKSTDKAIRYIKEFNEFNLLSALVFDRIGYQHAVAEGQGIHEFERSKYNALKEYHKKTFKAPATYAIASVYKSIFNEITNTDILDLIESITNRTK